MHKRRSVNFCGIKFDAGHRNREVFMSRLMRIITHGLAFALFIFEVVCNTTLHNDLSTATRIGHTAALSGFEISDLGGSIRVSNRCVRALSLASGQADASPLMTQGQRRPVQDPPGACETA